MQFCSVLQWRRDCCLLLYLQLKQSIITAYGADGAWMQNSDGTLTFSANGDFSKFTGIMIDGSIIDSENYTIASGSSRVTLKNEYLTTLSVGTHTLTFVYSDGECSANFEVKTNDAHKHSYGTEWKYSEADHWHECSCGDKSDKSAHTFEWKTDKDASKTETGLKHEECSICGAKRNENTVIEKLPADDSGKAGGTDNTDNSGSKSDINSPKTGDESNMLLWAALLLISGGAAVGTVVVKKKKYNR